jgi:probable sporulation protein (polysaccharide deacetylase family)
MIANAMEPIEPRHDSVWQFVPGLYGLEFDFQLSYQNMLINGAFDPELMVARSIPYSGSSDEFRRYRIYKGNEGSPYVALLINVAWGGDELSEILDILDEHHVRASIFFEGKFADHNRELVLEVFNRGHIVGNHSYSHPVDWLNFSYAGFEEEIVRTNEILTSITGEPVIYFAPPGGAFTDETIQAAYDQGMYTILWSADSIDWRGESANVLVNRVMRRIGPGGLILTHPKPETVRALPEIIEGVRSEGYEFSSIDDIVNGVRRINP